MRRRGFTMVLVMALAVVLVGAPIAGLAAPDGDAIGGIVDPGDGNPPPSMWPNCWKCSYAYAGWVIPIPAAAECEHATIETGYRGPCRVVVTSHLTQDCQYLGGGPCSVPLASIATYQEIYDRPEVFER